MRYVIKGKVAGKVEEKVVEIHEKRENTVIILYNKTDILTSVYITNASSK